MVGGVLSWIKNRRQAKQWDRIAKGIGVSRETRRRALLGQEADVEWLEKLLFDADPIGLNYESNTDEYRSEAETITLRRAEASSEGDVQRIVHQEFARWFDPTMAGPPTRYAEIAATVWLRWSATDMDDVSG